MKDRIAVVDLGISNIGSVLHALARVGAPPHELATPGNVATAAAVLLPGVGAFGDGMESLKRAGLVEPIRRAARAGTPIFGICLGMQLLADRSEEFGSHEGLGLVAGLVRRLEPRSRDFRVPNIGWFDVKPLRESALYPSAEGGCCYHVHSYHFVPEDRSAIAATIDYDGRPVVVAIESGTLFGVQFHPEKSQDDGLTVLSDFFRALRGQGRTDGPSCPGPA